MHHSLAASSYDKHFRSTIVFKTGVLIATAMSSVLAESRGEAAYLAGVCSSGHLDLNAPCNAVNVTENETISKLA